MVAYVVFAKWLQHPAGSLAAALIGIVLGAIYYQATVTVIGFHRAEKARAQIDDTEARESAYDAVRAVILAVPLGDPHAILPNLETALFILAEAKGVLERADHGSDNIEGKATTLISIVAGASSALGIFGLTKEGRAVVAAPLILLAFFFTAIALGCLLYIVRSKRFDSPGVEPFISPAIVSEDNRVGIALLLARDYHLATDSLLRAIRYEPLALFIAYVAIAAAAGLVLLNAATGMPWWGGTTTSQPSAPPSVAATSPGPARSPRTGTPARHLNPGKPSPRPSALPTGNRSRP